MSQLQRTAVEVDCRAIEGVKRAGETPALRKPGLGSELARCRCIGRVKRAGETPFGCVQGKPALRKPGLGSGWRSYLFRASWSICTRVGYRPPPTIDDPGASVGLTDGI